MPDELEHLSGAQLSECLREGLNRLIQQRDHLNKINVFPVPDGDTGNNLAQTALAAREAINAANTDTAGAVLVALADGSLDGAQGNSGAILAQFFQGLSARLGEHTIISTKDFSAALDEAAAYTRTALEKPVEGTILSVIDAAAAAAKTQKRSKDFGKLIKAMLGGVRTALSETTEKLEQLRKAGVVDAGAQGFCAFLEGLSDNLLHGIVDENPVVAADTFDVDRIPAIHDISEIDLEFRYCTECTLTGDSLDIARVRTQLQALGNSMVIAGSPARMHIHIHTNEPETIFELAAELGAVSKTKADDMLGQARSLNRSSRDVTIVIDSAADIPDRIMADMGIHMVPLRIQIGSSSHLDKSGISPAELRLEMKRSKVAPSTSQPTPGDLRRMYEFLGTHFREIVSISLGEALSGTYQAAMTAAQRTPWPERIRVINSRNVSVGQGLIATRAARLAEDGLRGDELQQAIEKELASVHSFALVADLENGVRSGRVKPYVKHIADWLRLTPILRNTAEGKIGVSGVLFGKRNLIKRFARHIAKKVADQGAVEYAIAHGYSEAKDAAELDAALAASLPDSSCAWHTEIGSALGIHTGMEALVVATIPLALQETQ